MCFELGLPPDPVAKLEVDPSEEFAEEGLLRGELLKVTRV